MELVPGQVWRAGVMGRKGVGAWVKRAAVAGRGWGSARTWRAVVVVRVVMRVVRGFGVGG